MIFLLLIIFMIIINSIQFEKAGQFNTHYAEKDNANIIKGFFVLLVFLSHGRQYISLSSTYDIPYLKFSLFLGQMIVAMFLFYSGYGIMESIQKKGFHYIKGIPMKRFLKVLINFDIAVLLYIVLGLSLGQAYDVKTIILALTGWVSIGNSNWYILAILILYVLTFIAFFITKFTNTKSSLFAGTLILTLLSVIFVYFEMKMGKDSWYYNTIILFPLGCWFSLLKPYIDRLVQKNDIVYTFTAMLTVFLTLYFSINRQEYGIKSYTLWAIFFTLAIVLFTMKISFKPTILSWFGEHIFSIYILQRLPMIFLHHLGISFNHRYMFLLSSFMATLFLAHIFDYLTTILWKKVNKS